MNIIKKIQEFLEKGDAEINPKNAKITALLIVITIGMMLGHFLTVFFLSIK